MPRRLARVSSAVFLSAVFTAVSVFGQLPAGPGDWPQWRGPNRDGISLDKGLRKEWPEGGPKLLWQVDTVGVGYSSLSVKDGRIFTQGDLDGVEHVIALSVEDGRVLWAVQPEPVAAALDKQISEEMLRLDRDNDGKITAAETLMRLGNNFSAFDKAVEGDAATIGRIAEQRVDSLMQSLDADRDGKLSFEEAANSFRDQFSRIDAEDAQADAAGLVKSRTAAYLQQLDKNADEKISREESRRSEVEPWFGRADKQDPTTKKGDEQLTGEEIEAYLGKYEPGKDGVVTPGELAGYFVKTQPGKDGVTTAEELRGLHGGYRNGMGDGPRGTPTVDGDRVYVEGGNGDLSCHEAATGKTIWYVNLSRDFGGGRPGWGYSESPLIEGDLLIVTPGGKKGTLLALNKFTGEPVWQSGEVTEGAHYSSPVAVTIGGVRQIVQFAHSSAFGVTVDGGKFLWKYGAANNGTANAFTPIVAADHVFVSSGYGTGSGLAKIRTADGKQSAEQVYFEKALGAHHGGAVKIGDYLYSNAGGELMCLNFLMGKIAWKDRCVGKGSLVAADGMLYVLSEGHQVALVEATPEAYREHGRFKIESHGRPSWAHPVVAGGRLYLRDQQSLAAYDVRGE